MLSFFPFTPYPVQCEAISFLQRCFAQNTPAFLNAPTGTGKTAILFQIMWDWFFSREASKGADSGASTPACNSVNTLPAWVSEVAESEAQERIRASRTINAAFLSELFTMIKRYETREAIEGLLQYIAKGVATSMHRGSANIAHIAALAEPGRKLSRANQYAFLFAFLGLDKVLNPETYVALTHPLMATAHAEYDYAAAATSSLYTSKGYVVLATRTHAQITQLINSFQTFKQALQVKGTDVGTFTYRPIISLAGRDTYCLAASEHSGDIEDISEFCDRLRADSACRYYSPATLLIGTALCLSSLHTPAHFRDQCKALGICPYYSARHATKHASVIIITHALLAEELDRAPHALGLLAVQPLLILVDEAHALPSVLEARRSTVVTIEDIDFFLRHLCTYLGEVRPVIVPVTARLLDRLIAILRLIKKYIVKAPQGNQLMGIKDGLEAMKVAGFNFGEALQLILEKKIPQKLCCTSISRQQPKNTTTVFQGRSKIYSVIAMLRIFAEVSMHGTYVFYICGDEHRDGSRELRLCNFSLSGELNRPKPPFHSIFTVTRDGERHYDAQLAFVSGTLDPFSYYSRELLGCDVSPDNCCSINHIVPPENTLIQQVSAIWVNNVKHPALFTARSWTEDIVQHVFSTIYDLARRGENTTGTLVFLQSYRVVAMFRKHYEQTAHDKSTIRFFFEESKVPVDTLMNSYREFLTSGRCVLVASAGGRISEGIDFKDELCRRLMVVGIPLPDITDPLVQRKDQQYSGRYSLEHALKLINQCIGRGIRHKNDWCSYILLDIRFADNIPRLSAWVQHRIKKVECINEAVDNIVAFERGFCARKKMSKAP